MVAWQQVKGRAKRILPLVLVAKCLEHLTSITEVILLWNSENLFLGFFMHCQENITNVDIDKANKATLVGAEDNLLATHEVTKLHLFFKHCPSVGGNKCRMYWNREGTVQIQNLHCVWRIPACLLFWLDLLQSIFCHSQVLAIQLLSTCVFLKGSCLSLRI